jgi:hypothetical protein
VAGHHPGQRLELRIADRLEQEPRDHLALAADDAVDGAVGVLEELGGDERCALSRRKKLPNAGATCNRYTTHLSIG